MPGDDIGGLSAKITVTVPGADAAVSELKRIQRAAEEALKAVDAAQRQASASSLSSLSPLAPLPPLARPPARMAPLAAAPPPPPLATVVVPPPPPPPPPAGKPRLPTWYVQAQEGLARANEREAQAEADHRAALEKEAANLTPAERYRRRALEASRAAQGMLGMGGFLRTPDIDEINRLMAEAQAHAAMYQRLAGTAGKPHTRLAPTHEPPEELRYDLFSRQAKRTQLMAGGRATEVNPEEARAQMTGVGAAMDAERRRVLEAAEAKMRAAQQAARAAVAPPPPPAMAPGALAPPGAEFIDDPAAFLKLLQLQEEQKRKRKKKTPEELLAEAGIPSPAKAAAAGALAAKAASAAAAAAMPPPAPPPPAAAVPPVPPRRAGPPPLPPGGGPPPLPPPLPTPPPPGPRRLAALMAPAGAFASASISTLLPNLQALAGAGVSLGRAVGRGMVRGLFWAGPALSRATHGLLKQMADDPVRAFNDRVVGGVADLVNRIPVVGPLLAAPIEAVQSALNVLIDAYEMGVKMIDEVSRHAASVGVPVGQMDVLERTFKLYGTLSGAGNAAGGGQLFQRGLLQLQKLLGDASVGGERARKVFQGLGLDGRALAQVAEADMTQAMGQVADRIMTLPTAALRARAAMELFGRGGLTVLPMLAQGSKAIDDMRDRMKRLGLGVTQADVGMVRMAQRAQIEFKMMLESVALQVTRGLAPVLGGLGQMMAEPGFWGKGFSGLADQVFDFAKTAITALGVVGDFLQAGQFWEAAAAQSQKFFATVLRGIATVMDALPSLGEGFLQWLGMSPEMAKGFGLGAGWGKAPAQISTGLKAQADKMSEGADAAIKDMKKRQDDLAKAGGQEKVSGWAKRWIDRAEALRKGVLPEEGFKDPFGLVREGLFKLAEDSRSPLDHLKKGMQELALLAGMTKKAFEESGEAVPDVLGLGVGTVRLPEKGGMFGFMAEALSGAAEGAFGGGMPGQDLLALGAFKQLESLRSGLQLDPYRLSGAMQKGSREAYTTEVRDRLGNESIQEELLRLAQAAQVQRDQQIEEGKAMLKAWQDGLFVIGGL